MQLPVKEVQEATKQMEKLGRVGKQDSQTVVLEEEGLDDQLLLMTREATLAILTTLVILFFLLGWGDRFTATWSACYRAFTISVRRCCSRGRCKVLLQLIRASSP